MPSESDRDRIHATQARARISPMRSRMLDLYEQNPNRPMDPQLLTKELAAEGWDVSLSQVNYHLRKLADAELIPAPCPGG
jgi:Fe2+ or Zn2+ uptake regulation protein